MKNIKFLALGVLFGIILTKSEAISWYRIYEMFKFQSFHMYGIIGSAIIISIGITQLFKRGILKDYLGNTVTIKNKPKGIVRPLFGGILFGLGWALAGLCPGPIFVLLGSGAVSIIVVLIGSLLGAYLKGVLNDKLP